MSEPASFNGTIVIVGTGHAGAAAAETLRRDGHTGRLVLIGAEPHPPYQRPPLSKKYLAGELPFERMLIKPAPFYEQHRIELRTSARVAAIDIKAHSISLEDGEQLAYDRLLLCTGSEPHRLPIPGNDLRGVFYIRNADEVTAIRAQLRPGARLVIVGGGYIGLEVAATCRQLGLEVSVLEMADRVMSRVVAPVVSEFYMNEHATRGVQIDLGAAVQGFEGDGAVREVVCGDGRRFPADIVIVGVGVRPCSTLALQAGIDCDNGIVVDEFCRTSAAEVFAAGDCTNHPSARFGRRVRLESVDNAFEQGRAAAANLLGRATAHDRVPWFWSDQFDLKLLIVGLTQGHDQLVVRGAPASRCFSVCYLRGGELVALDAVNNAKDYMAARKLIAERVRPDPARLRDPAIALKEA